MFSNRPTLYWLLTGAVFGFGIIGILSIGLPFLVLGLVLVIVGMARVGVRGFWAVICGFGLLPALLLLWDVTTSPWACTPAAGGVTSQVGVNYYSCVDTPVGALTTYHVMAFWFGVIALLGLVWPLLALLVRRTRHGAA